MRQTWSFNSIDSIIFGQNSIGKINHLIERFKGSKVLIITDPGIAKAGILDKVIEKIDSRNEVIVYDKVVPEPPIESAIECYHYAKDVGPDLVIGLGGGSSIDLAKVVSLLLTHGGHPADYFGENKVPGPTIPLIAIPTTAGTGSEVTPVAVLTDVENDLKVGISDNYIRPTVALLDPMLTVGLPPYVTACSGIDALSHAIESYTTIDYRYLKAEGEVIFQGASPITDHLALGAIEKIAKHLKNAVLQGTNIEARSEMLLASLMAGMAFSNAGNAAAHALAYPIGGFVKSPHGEVTGLLLPYVMEYNLPVISEKLANISKAFGYSEQRYSQEELATMAPEIVLDLLADIGLPTRLSEIGIKEENIEVIAEKGAAIERLMRNNPRTPDAESLKAMLYHAL